MIDLAHLNSPDKTESAAMYPIHLWLTKKFHWLHPEATLLKNGDYARKNGGGGLMWGRERG